MRTIKKNEHKHFLNTCLVLILSLSSASQLFAADRLKVAYISSVELSHPFWGQIVSFMQAVAEDLDIDLNITVESENRFILKNKGLKLINSPERPNYMIASYFPGVIPEMIEAGRVNDVGIFVFNANFSKEDSQRIGLPREKFKNFIGHMYPDGIQAGFLLADILMKQARKKGLADAGMLQVLALRGKENPYARDAREYGLKRWLKSSKDAEIIGSLASDWSRELAKKNAAKILSQFPKAPIIWAASDLMALGGAEAAVALGRKPGEDILLGGFDWAPEALQAVAKGEMAVSLGGHFMEAGWALILLHDYHHGIDFKEELGEQILTSMQAITTDNIQKYMSKFKDQRWSQVDFKKFSKKYNPKLEKYDFSLEALLK